MLISPAFAGHFMADDGNTGGGDTLLIILGVGLVLGLLYVGQKNVAPAFAGPPRRERIAGAVKTSMRTGSFRNRTSPIV